MKTKKTPPNVRLKQLAEIFTYVNKYAFELLITKDKESL